MLSRRTFTAATLAWSATGCSVRPELSGSRLRFVSGHSRLLKDATKEGVLRIDAATSLLGADALLEAFRKVHPDIVIEHRSGSSRDLHVRFLQEAGAGMQTADVLISSAMDLQFKLVNDGYALQYVSPEKPHLPDWAVWKDQAYAVNTDPLVFAYNEKLMPAADIPRSHHELADLLRRKPEQYRGKIASYDPEQSGTGYLYYTQDLLLSRDTLDLLQAVGQTQPKFYLTGAESRNRVSSGEHLLAYNMVNSFMIQGRSQFPDVGIVFPNDYTLVMSRYAFIPKLAKHPAAGKLFLDFMLSEPGQALMASQHLQPVRDGIVMDGPAPSPEVLRRIHFGPSLLANLDEFRRRRVLHERRRTLDS